MQCEQCTTYEEIINNFDRCSEVWKHVYISQRLCLQKKGREEKEKTGENAVVLSDPSFFLFFFKFCTAVVGCYSQRILS